MKYTVLLYEDERIALARTPEQRNELMTHHRAFAERVAAAGGTVSSGGRLLPTTAATTLRWDGDTVAISDGPFAETAEQLGGYYVVDLPDLDAAIAAASALPHDAELRPVVEYEPNDGAGPVDGGDAPSASDAEPGATPAESGDAGEPAAAVEGPLHVVLLYGDEEPWLRATPDEREAMYAKHAGYAAAAAGFGVGIEGGHELTHSSTATTLRHVGGEIVVSDGPFAETAEQLTGFYLVRAPSIDHVVRHLDLLPGDVTEIRPVFENAHAE